MPVYRIERAATVPVAAPPANPGAGVARTGLGAASIVPQAPKPVLDGNSDAGLYLPLHTLAVEPRIALGRHMELRFSLEVEADSGPMAVRQIGVGHAAVPVWGFGQGVSGHRIFEDVLFLTYGAQLFIYDIPSRVRVVCVENCGGYDPYGFDPYGGDTVEYEGDSIEHSTAAVIRGQATFGVQGDLGSAYILLGFRSQPTNDGNDSEATYGAPSREPEVDSFGGVYGLLGVGATLSLHESFDLVGQVFAPVGGDPIDYGPILSVGLFAGLPVKEQSGDAVRPSL